MIDQTFLGCLGVGPATELKIKNMGIETWGDFLEFDGPSLISDKLRNSVVQDVTKLQSALNQKDLIYLTKNIPSKEHWRILREYHNDVSYFDIETSGLDADSTITVIGCLHKGRMYEFVAGENLDDFVDLMEDISIFASFNGSSFDVPRILNEFSLPELDCAHLDLRWICYHQGFKGGLKSIENQLDCQRHDSLIGLSGMDAVILWEGWKKRGDVKAKEILINYCLEDVYSLERLSHKLIDGPNLCQSQ